MKRSIWIVVALVFFLAGLVPHETWATPTRDVYDVPDPESNSGDDDEPGHNLSAPPSTGPSEAGELQSQVEEARALAVESIRANSLRVRLAIQVDRFGLHFKTLIRRID